MKLCSPHPAIERAQPWLGTLVSIRVEGLASADANVAISAAFQEVALVHRLMSFQQQESDVSRINREGCIRNVEVHAHTLEVLNQAMAISSATNGCFDISVGADLVRWGWLPSPVCGGEYPGGTWRDIEVTAARSVSLRRPLWIDLGGIAKGYAVDVAAKRLREHGVVDGVINAGGDIRVLGKRPEQITLGLDDNSGALPMIELSDGSIASSSSDRQRRLVGLSHGPHVNGMRRLPTSENRFVCVLAERCVIADALTKVVMAEGLSSEAVLRQFEASAHLLDQHTGWRSLNAGVNCQ